MDPLGNRTSYTFDLAGQQTSRQDARGNRITYSYDHAGRQINLRNELNLAPPAMLPSGGQGRSSGLRRRLLANCSNRGSH